ncbi:hypothetical protein DL95DRAFT_117238 [Leptodontidium sp. 2 PMI_412]|nr:hypothetical protein DL95DRAFT_117238 [Leptodontidium sp. 2 PMI_412]
MGGRDRPSIDYFPRSEQGCIIFTTRDRKTAMKLAHPTKTLRYSYSRIVCLINSDLVNDTLDTVAFLKS